MHLLISLPVLLLLLYPQESKAYERKAVIAVVSQEVPSVNLGFVSPDIETTGDTDVLVKRQNIDGESGGGDDSEGKQKKAYQPPKRPVLTPVEHFEEIVVLPAKEKEEQKPAFTREKLNEILQQGADTAEELRAAANLATERDENLQKITFGEEQIGLAYTHPAKLFGFVPVSYTLKAVVKDDGDVKTKKPWWLFLATDKADEVEKAAKEQIVLQQKRSGPFESRQRAMEIVASVMRSVGNSFNR